MKEGKQTCKILKDIRRQIAKANDIEFTTANCQYKGDCPGTCPQCEAEVRYLEEQIAFRKSRGLDIRIAGISLAALAVLPLHGQKAVRQQPVVREKQQNHDFEQNRDLPEVEIVGNGTRKFVTVTAGGILCAHFTPTKRQLKRRHLISYKSLTPVDNTAFADKDNQYEEGNRIDTPAQPQSAFFRNGGYEEYIRMSIHYPNTRIYVAGDVEVSFTINKNGRIVNSKITRSLHPLFDKEVLKALGIMSHWQPATVNGKATESTYKLVISFLKPEKKIKTSIVDLSENTQKLIRGRVVDSEGCPVNNVHVVYGNLKQQKYTHTNADGYFHCYLSRNRKKISFISDGMKKQHVRIRRQQQPYVHVVMKNQ